MRRPAAALKAARFAERGKKHRTGPPKIEAASEPAALVVRPVGRPSNWLQAERSELPEH
jgi:hypothetical protein